MQTEHKALGLQAGFVMHGVVFLIPRLLCRVESVWLSHAAGLCYVEPGNIFPPSCLLLVSGAGVGVCLFQKHWVLGKAKAGDFDLDVLILQLELQNPEVAGYRVFPLLRMFASLTSGVV